MTAIVPVNDEYRIELDTYNWAVARYAPRKNKSKKQWEQFSWHRTLQQAGVSLVERLVAEDDLEGTEEVIAAIRTASTLIATAIRESPHPDSWPEANVLYSDAGC